MEPVCILDDLLFGGLPGAIEQDLAWGPDPDLLAAFDDFRSDPSDGSHSPSAHLGIAADVGALQQAVSATLYPVTTPTSESDARGSWPQAITTGAGYTPSPACSPSRELPASFNNATAAAASSRRPHNVRARAPSVARACSPPSSSSEDTGAASTSSGEEQQQQTLSKRQAAANKRKAPEVDWRSIPDPAERRKQRRLAKNRITAARSRERKKEQWGELQVQLGSLKDDNQRMKTLLEAILSENAQLKQQLASLNRGAAVVAPTGAGAEPAALQCLVIMHLAYLAACEPPADVCCGPLASMVSKQWIGSVPALSRLQEARCVLWFRLALSSALLQPNPVCCAAQQPQCLSPAAAHCKLQRRGLLRAHVSVSSAAKLSVVDCVLVQRGCARGCCARHAAEVGHQQENKVWWCCCCCWAACSTLGCVGVGHTGHDNRGKGQLWGTRTSPQRRHQCVWHPVCWCQPPTASKHTGCGSLLPCAMCDSSSMWSWAHAHLARVLLLARAGHVTQGLQWAISSCACGVQLGPCCLQPTDTGGKCLAADRPDEVVAAWTAGIGAEIRRLSEFVGVGVASNGRSCTLLWVLEHARVMFWAGGQLAAGCCLHTDHMGHRLHCITVCLAAAPCSSRVHRMVHLVCV